MPQVDWLNGLTGTQGIKDPVTAVSNGVLTLSGVQTVNGVAVVAADRVLVKDQASAVDNGIYDVQTGTWTRATDFDGASDVRLGTLVYGPAGVGYYVSAIGTIGTDNASFTLITATTNGPLSVLGNLTVTGAISATAPLTITGTTIGSASTVWVGTSASGGAVLNAATGSQVNLTINNSTIAQATSTGVAVTGTLSTTDNITVAKTLDGYASVLVANPSSGSSGTARFYASSDAGNVWLGATSATWGVISGASDAAVLNVGSLSGGFQVCIDGAAAALKVTAGAVVVTGALTCSTGFGANGNAAQTKYTVNAASTDLTTVVALCNQLRAALVANGICV